MKGIFNVAETETDSMPYEAEAQRQRCMKMNSVFMFFTRSYWRVFLFIMIDNTQRGY
ncbi:hypothetical protein IRB23SM22_19910 [Alkalibacterium sp. s-m-22]|uniref:Uncharacterized protein n=1 Tax=Alkalibacterium indicireducens TaxID=398758 RepID=A0ABN1BC11_9LACT